MNDIQNEYSRDVCCSFVSCNKTRIFCSLNSKQSFSHFIKTYKILNINCNINNVYVNGIALEFSDEYCTENFRN